jgi:peptidoglycan/LPS O-acetylase OafA/YrhL
MATPGSSAESGEAATLEAPRADETRKTPFRLGNHRALTGIRALAMATVLVYHANFGAMPGSWVALQIFFVLSGFLITAMLASEAQRHGRISLTRFYSRRAVRLLPPLFLAVGLVAIYASFVHVWESSQRVWGDSLAALFYYADYRSALGHAPLLGFFAQTWSLSVEEQFYIVWSILLAVAIARGRRRMAYGIAAAGMVLSAVDRTWISLAAPHFTQAVAARTYYAFDTRADALFFGCLLGLMAADGYFQRLPTWVPRALTAAAAVATVVLVWVLFEVPVWTLSTMVFWQPATTVASAVLIMYFVLCPVSLGTRFVGLGAFVFLGELSYTVYLVHFGVYLALEPGSTGTHWSFWPTELLRLAIILGLATGSWFLIERPLARWRARSAAG